MKRSGNEPFHGPMRTSTATWRKPIGWSRKAGEAGQRLRVFTCSLSDFFHEAADDWRDDAWNVMRECTHLDWLVLTKRPQLIRDRLPPDWNDGYPNVWLGTTVESQAHIGRVDLLTEIPAAIRFISAEPLLGPVQFGAKRMKKLDWIITGCEQAHKDKRRLLEFDWVRSIRDECDAFQVPLFHKQHYEGTQLSYSGIVDGEKRQSWPKVACNAMPTASIA